MRYIGSILCAATLALAANSQASTVNTVDHSAFQEVAINEITPRGWIRNWLKNQAAGLTGNPAELGYPYDQPLWTKSFGKHPVHQQAQPWWPYEQTGYQIDAMIRTGHLLGDQKLLDTGVKAIENVLASVTSEGYIFPGPEIDSWPTAVFMRAVMAHYSATKDPKILEVLSRYYKSNIKLFAKGGRASVNIEPMIWLYQQTGDREILNIAQKVHKHSQKNKKSIRHLDHMASDVPSYSHGVVHMELSKLPAILYMASGEQALLDGTVNEYGKMERDHMLVDGVPSSDEHLSGRAAVLAHETCDITDYSWSLGYLLRATGDSHWADNIEKATFNALPGAVTKDFKALQYFSSPNQMLSTGQASRKNRMNYRPGFITQCCSGNVSRAVPNYASRMWMKRGNDTLVAAMYGPSSIRTQINGQQIQVDQNTNYPFEEEIEFVFGLKKAQQFSFAFRIPHWAKDAKILVNGKTTPVKSDEGFAYLDRKFKDGDVVRLQLPMQLSMKQWRNEKIIHKKKKYDDEDFAEKNQAQLGGDGVYFEYGPLVMSLQIEEKHTVNNAPLQVRSKGYKGEYSIGSDNFPAWDIEANSPWNYGIKTVNGLLADKAKVHKRDMPINPWIAATTPLSITLPAYQINNWKFTKQTQKAMRHGQPKLPMQPAAAKDSEQVTLIPLGSTHLRTTIFPELKH